MQKRTFKGNTENLNILNNKVNYIGFELGEVPEFLKQFEPLNYRVPKVYDETTYKVYKYVPISDIEILITPINRLEDLGERYKYASPLFTYMKAENNEQIEKYAQFLKMINQTRLEDIESIENEQEQMKEGIPFEVKFPTNFKWQIYYSDYANKYFMMASTEESDNSEMFYLLKKKIQENNNEGAKESVFVPISNEEYSEKILKKSEIADLENYLWYFTKNWPSIYEVTDKKGELSLQIVGETTIYDKVISKYKIEFTDRKSAEKEYKLIKALFILANDIENEFKFETKIDENGGLMFTYEGERVEYATLPEFLKKQAVLKLQENINIKLETRELNADIKDLQRKSEEQNEEYRQKEKQIYTFLECKKTFLGKVKYFFKSRKKTKEEAPELAISKDRMKDILSTDKTEEKLYDAEAEANKLYTVEDLIKICKELNETIRENKNIKLDIKAIKIKVENLDRKIKNATQYLEEIEKHKKSIFEFWKFANKDEVKSLEEGLSEEKGTTGRLKKTFNYEDDIEDLANSVDKEQRSKLTGKEMDATFAANFVLDGINILSKDQIVKEDEEKIIGILQNLKGEYKKDIEKIEAKDFDIFGNVSEDKTKIKLLKNNTHREVEKDKFKILNVNLNTELDAFMEKLVEIKNILKEETHKIKTPYDLSLYRASKQILETDGFSKFSLSPVETLKKLEDNSDDKEVYLYKINVPEKTNIIFYTNIIFFQNNNETLPLGMDISQETLIDLDMYNLELKDKEEFNIVVCKNEFDAFLRNVKVYEYDIKEKKS